MLTILQVISAGRRSASYAEHANPSVESLESDSSKILAVGVQDSLPNLRRQGDAESWEKACDQTEAEAGVPSTTHLLCHVVGEEGKESEARRHEGKSVNSSPPCSARHEEEANRDVDPATPPEVESSPPRETAEEENEAEQRKRRGGCNLHLLVEAARHLEPGFGEDEESERGSDVRPDSSKRAAMEVLEPAAPAAAKRRRRRRDWAAAAAYLGAAFEEDIAPVVRSKRGRNQVLPSRFRDSVIEPWKAAPRPSW